MTQTIEYVVKVNATEAQAAIADVEKKFGGVDSIVARVDKSIIAAQRDIKDLSAAIAAGGPNVDQYKKELDGLNKSLGIAEKKFVEVSTVVTRIDKNVSSAKQDIAILNAAIAAGGPNVNQYKQELERLNSSLGMGKTKFVEVDSVVTKIDRSFQAAQRDIRELNAAIAAGGPNVDLYKKELDSLNRSMGLSGQTASKSGKFGSGLLQGAAALDDLQYGIKGVVNNIPGVLTGFGIGAGIAGAAQIAAIGVAFLTDKITNYIKEQQKAVLEASQFKQAILDMRIGALETTKSLEDKLAELEAKSASGKPGVFALELNKKLEEISRTRSDLQDQIRKLQKIGQSKTSRDETHFYFAMSEEERKRYDGLKDQLAIQDDLTKEAVKQYDLKVKINELEEKGNKKGKEEKKQKEEKDETEIVKWRTKTELDKMEREEQKKLIEERKNIAYQIVSEERKLREEAAQHEMDIEREIREQAIEHGKKLIEEREKAEEKHLQRLDQLQGNSLASKMAFDDYAKEHQIENLNELSDHEYKILQQRLKQSEEFYQDYFDLVKGVSSLSIKITQDYFDAKITGTKNAEMLAAAAFLKGTGEQLVGIGTKQVFEGTGFLIASGGMDARGLPLVGLGAAAIAAGMGMGAGGSAVGHIAAGGTIGKPLDKKKDKDRGAAPKRKKDKAAGEDGPLVINVTYGAGGPLPEDIAREIQKVTRSGNRRRGSA